MIGASIGRLGSIGRQGGVRQSLIPSIAGVSAFAGFDFTGAQPFYHNLTPTFARAGTGTIENNGAITTVPAGVLRVQGGRFLVEGSRTNRLLNSDVVASQLFSTTGLQATLSFYGTGSITLSGTATGTLSGTGANNRVALTFTPTTGTLTITPSGDVRFGQFETGASATSYIPTGGTQVNRPADTLSFDLSGLSANLTSGCWIVIDRWRMGGNNANFDRLFQMDDGGGNANSFHVVRSVPTNNFAMNQQVGGVSGAGFNSATAAVTQPITAAFRYGLNNAHAIWWDGTQASDTVAPYVAPNIMRIAAGPNLTADKPASLTGARMWLFPQSITPSDMAAYRASLPQGA